MHTPNRDGLDITDLPHNVTMSITVQYGSLRQYHTRCVDQMRYMASGVRSFTCKNYVVGPLLEITWSGSWKMGVCEIEVFGREYIYVTNSCI